MHYEEEDLTLFCLQDVNERLTVCTSVNSDKIYFVMLTYHQVDLGWLPPNDSYKTTSLGGPHRILPGIEYYFGLMSFFGPLPKKGMDR